MSERARILIHARGRLTPDECDFWQRLHRALEADGAELWLLAHNHPQAPIDPPHARVPNGLDAAGPLADCVRESEDESRAVLAADGLDADLLLARERQWRGAEPNAAQISRRLRSLRVYQAVYSGALAACRPHVVFVWNGEHPQEIILRTLAARAGAHVSVLERGPFAGTMHPDDAGILGASAVAQRSEWRWSSGSERAHWLDVFDRLRDASRSASSTWWAQPDAVGAEELRRRLGVGDTERVALFLGQVDADAQGFLFAPRFENNLRAWRTFLERADASRAFLLGKHHPKSQTPAEAYRTALGAKRGAWLDDVAMSDCLALADAVCAVNSTGLFEALLLGKPCLMLGRGVLSGKNIAHEPSPELTERVVTDWLVGADQHERTQRFRDFGAHLLARELFTMQEKQERLGLRGAGALAAWLLARTETWPAYDGAAGVDPWRRPVLTRDGELALRDVTREKASVLT